MMLSRSSLCSIGVEVLKSGAIITGKTMLIAAAKPMVTTEPQIHHVFRAARMIR